MTDFGITATVHSELRNYGDSALNYGDSAFNKSYELR